MYADSKNFPTLTDITPGEPFRDVVDNYNHAREMGTDSKGRSDVWNDISRHLQASGVDVDSASLTLERHRIDDNGDVLLSLKTESIQTTNSGTVETQLQYIHNARADSVEIKIQSGTVSPDGESDLPTQVSLMLNKVVSGQRTDESFLRLGMQLNADGQEDLWIFATNGKITSIGIDEETYADLPTELQEYFQRMQQYDNNPAYGYDVTRYSDKQARLVSLELNHALRVRTNSDEDLLPPDPTVTEIDIPHTVQAFMNDEMYSHRPGEERSPNAVIPLVFYKTE